MLNNLTTGGAVILLFVVLRLLGDLSSGIHALHVRVNEVCNGIPHCIKRDF